MLVQRELNGDVAQTQKRRGEPLVQCGDAFLSNNFAKAVWDGAILAAGRGGIDVDLQSGLEGPEGGGCDGGDSTRTQGTEHMDERGGVLARRGVGTLEGLVGVPVNGPVGDKGPQTGGEAAVIGSQALLLEHALEGVEEAVVLCGGGEGGRALHLQAGLDDV